MRRKSISFLAALAAALLSFASAGWAESDKFRLVWTGDPATTMTIGWSQAGGEAAGVTYGTDADALADAVFVPVEDTTVYDNTRTPEGPPLISHFVTLRDLEPDTAYYFTVDDSEGAGDVMWFKTAPDSPAPFTFVGGGDSRTNPQGRVWGNQMVARLRPLFIAHGGDYQDDCTNDEMRVWLDEWQETRSPDGRMYPVIPAHGNHENDMIDFVALIFNMPNPDAYYAQNVGGDMMRLYTLNTEREPGVGYGAFQDQDSAVWDAQTRWLAEDMAANPDFTWKIANYHRPMRPHRDSKAEGPGRIEAWAHTFFANGMDLAVECDSHLLKYTYPLRPGEEPGSFESFVRDDENGTMFIGEGSWGAPTRVNDDDKPWTMASDSVWQFKLIHAAPDRLDIHTVMFGDQDETGNPVLGYNMDDIAPLTQAEQDADPFALPVGIEQTLWRPLPGTAVSLPFTGANIDNVEYVSTGAAWKYLDDGGDQGDAWTAPGFDDSAWAEGNGQLGYGDGDETTEIGFGDDPDDKHITAYFRKTVAVADTADLLKLKLMLLRDDGAVVHINGTEAIRSSMPDGPVNFETRANDAGDEDKYFEYDLNPALLIDGENTIAVEVHQSGPTSSDASFDMVLYGIVSNTDGAAPAAPTGLNQVAVDTSTLEIGWTDNADDEVGFELWRREGDGAWEILAPALNPNTTDYGQTMLSEGTAYTYKVRAFNAAGLSAFTEDLAVTTLVAQTPVVYENDFNDGTLGQFASVSVSSNQDWEAREFPAGSGAYFAAMNGFGADMASDDWLISPTFNLFAYADEYVTADLAYNFDGPELEVLVSDNYDSGVHANPTDAHWRTLPAVMPSTGNYAYQPMGELDLALTAADFDADFGVFTPISAASNADWTIEERAGKIGAIANGFGADAPSDDWLLSPALPVGADAELEIAFQLYRRYDGPDLEVMVSTDYDGGGDPSTATWASYPIPHDDISDAWKPVSVTHAVDSGGTAYVAFRYTSTGTGGGEGARLGVDDVTIQPTSGTVAFRYVSTGTGGGDGRAWQMDNFEFRGGRVTFAEEDFDEPILGETTFAAFSAASGADWVIEERAGRQGAIANGFGADGPSDDWLIAQTLSVAPAECLELTFDHYRQFDGPPLEVMVSTDYDGVGDPTAGDFTWDSIPAPHDDISDEWASRTVDLCGYSGSVTVAFRYTSTGTGPGDGARLGVDNVQIARKTSTGLAADFTADETAATTIEPVTFTAFVSGGSEPYAYAWDFGDGGTSTEAKPAHTFGTAGTYAVELCVTDANGETACNEKAGMITVRQATSYEVPVKTGDLRVAAFNCFLNRSVEGEIVTDLAAGDDPQIQKVAEIIQRTRPDVILLNEFDYVADGSAVELLKRNYLEVGRNGADPAVYEHSFIAPSNTGIPSGVDLNNDGTVGGPNDAHGFGEFPGQYGMAILSKYPIDAANVRTFQTFLWKDMPDSAMPMDHYSAEAVEIFRLSSKSHWDVPVTVGGETIHLLASHPTPPVFDDGDAADGAVDWNGRRNHDEIRFWADYVASGRGDYIYDDDLFGGGLPEGARFVILGDQNADPDEGDSYMNAIDQLLSHAAVNGSFVPESDGAVDFGIDADDTASWGLRADYVLPSTAGVTVAQGEVFWPSATDDLFRLVQNDASSDHRLVWLDLTLTETGTDDSGTDDPGTDDPGDDDDGNEVIVVDGDGGGCFLRSLTGGEN